MHNTLNKSLHLKRKLQQSITSILQKCSQKNEFGEKIELQVQVTFSEIGTKIPSQTHI